MDHSSIFLNTPLLEDQEREDRREKLRINEPFSALVKGTDSLGRAFAIETVLDNLSASGLYLRMATEVDLGCRLGIRINMVVTDVSGTHGIRVATEGIVLRVDPLSDSSFGLAVRLTRKRLL